MSAEVLVSTMSQSISVALADKIANHQIAVTEYVAKVKALPAITSKETREELYTGLSALNKLSKALDEERKNAIAPMRAEIDAFNAMVEAKLINPLKDLIASRKPEIGAYDAEVEAKKQAELARLRAEQEAKAEAERKRVAKIEEERKAEEKRIQDEARKKAEDEAKKSKLTGIDARMAKKKAEDEAKALIEKKRHEQMEAENKIQIAASIEQAKLKNQEEDLERQKAKGGRKVWTFTVEDFAEVPDAFKSVEAKLVNDAIRAGTRAIPGLNIFQKDVTGL